MQLLTIKCGISGLKNYDKKWQIGHRFVHKTNQSPTILGLWVKPPQTL